MERGIALIAGGVLGLALLLLAGASIPIWIVGVLIAYVVMRSFRSDHPFFFALIWPIGLIILGIADLSNRQPRLIESHAVAAPPPPPAGMLGDDDAEWVPARPAAPPPPPASPPNR
jgi:hypothetical protein